MGVNKSEDKKAAEESQERYEAFLRNSQEGIWRFELEKPISTQLSVKKQIELMYKHAYLAEANLATARMYGFRSVKPLIGVRLGDFLIESDPANIEYLSAFIQSNYKLSGVESHEVDRFGKKRYFRNSLIGIVENGHIVRAWGTQQDITDQHMADKARRISENRLKIALKASLMGIWEWDIKTQKLYWSDELKEIFGLKPTEIIDFEKYSTMLHPDDRTKMLAVIQKALQDGNSYQIEHRIIRTDGSIHWVLGQGKAYERQGVISYMVGTSMLIDDRKQNEQERTELIKLNNAKDEFISIASHQLRTPATGVKQYVGMVLDGFAGELNQEQIQMLKQAYDSNERQIDIINDLLKVANVDAGKVNLSREKCDIVALLTNIIDEQKDKYVSRKQKLKFSTDNKRISIKIDARMMRMVFENFIDNASKYSPENAHISITVKNKSKDVVITIKDTGIGIGQSDYSKLFQKFSRIQNHLTAGIEGSGLGLYWSKKIVDLHDGRITFTSKLGSGTSFKISLPK